MASTKEAATVVAETDDIVCLDDGTIINASGHVQELERNFDLWSIVAVGIVTGSAWPAIGGSIVVALYNGGPPGVIYEFIVVTIFYFFIAASLAELASAIPSSAGVYHWATVTAGPKYSRAVGFFAGWWNLFAWIFGSATMANIQGNIIVSMWGLFHKDYQFQRWHVFIVYLIQAWLCCAVVLFANRALPWISNAGMVFILGGVFVTILVCAIMPYTTGSGYASSSVVWSEWQNQTGWDSNGFVFVAGMLNGAYSIGTPDCVSHLAEEIPYPKKNIPKAILVQLVVGFVTALLYLIAIFYAVNDLDNVTGSNYVFPLASVYQEATNSAGGSLGLLLVIFFPIVCTCIGTYLTNSRVLFTLARDNATPFSKTLSRVSPRWKNPFAACVANACVVTVLGCIYVGSQYAFNAFVGSFVIMSTLSYVAAILPHLLTNRRHVRPGPFYMKGWLGMAVHAVSSAYIIVFIVIFLFPYAQPVSAQNMNYSVVITGGLTLFVAFWWLWSARKGYRGPREQILEIMNSGPHARADVEHTEKL